MGIEGQLELTQASRSRIKSKIAGSNNSMIIFIKKKDK
jgi:hypothetical protein